MHIRDLSPKEHLHLCRLAEQRCARLLRALSRRARPQSRRLARVLGDMARDEEAHEAVVRRTEEGVDWPESWRLDRVGVHEMLKRHFPACLQDAGRLRPETEQLLAFVERLENQSCEFYRSLAELSQDPTLSAFFLDMMEREEAHMPSAILDSGLAAEDLRLPEE